MEREELSKMLTDAKIPVEQWGIGKAKTLEHLLQEINSGESELLPDPIVGCLRTLKVAMIDVCYRGAGRCKTLHEERQVFVDGRERRRNLDSSLGEKMHSNEKPADVARRALNEELGIDDEALVFLSIDEFTRGPEESPSYPGLQSIYKMFRFQVDLPDNHFRPEGYSEVAPDKTTYFVWL